MKTIIKWPGGKEKELQIIRQNTPTYTGRFVEPFVGGGAVFFDTDNSQCFLNDKSEELINLYTCIKDRNRDFERFLLLLQNEFYNLGDFVIKNKSDLLEVYHSSLSVDDFINQNKSYFLSVALKNNDIFMKELHKNLSDKIKRSRKLEYTNGIIPDIDRINNIEAAIKSAYYMYVRHLQNNKNGLSKGEQAAVFFFVREYCYSSMFRYNSQGQFNVPYGGISYNRKDFRKKINYLLSEDVNLKLKTSQLSCQDFEIFMENLKLTNEDFVFLDPPYDSEFSTYAQNSFGKKEQQRLCDCLKRTKAKFMMIIKNTDYIYNLYNSDFNITSFERKYMVSFKNRNDKNVKHLIITNY